MTADPKIEKLRATKREKHDAMVEAEHELESLNLQRKKGVPNLTPKIHDCRAERDKREKEWRAACDDLSKAKAAKKEAASTIDKIKPNRSLGAPHWGGCADISNQVCDPVAKKVRPADTDLIGASKEGGHQVGGDHDLAMTNSFARDYRTEVVPDTKMKQAMAVALGIEGTVNDYGFYYYLCDGHRYRWQPIAQQHGTGPHFHSGHRQA